MGRNVRKRNTSHNKKHGGHLAFKRSIRVKNRAKDMDQIQDEIQAHDPSVVPAIDLELPGLGQHYCLSCARHFNSSETLLEHKKSKVHKKQLKKSMEPQYTLAEAERAAGMGSAVNK